MGTNPLRVIDTLDDRREVWCLLRRLSPARMVKFLAWCCRHAKLETGPQRPMVARVTRELADKARWDTAAYERLLRETWTDLWMLVCQYDFNLDLALARLVEMVRRPQ